MRGWEIGLQLGQTKNDDSAFRSKWCLVFVCHTCLERISNFFEYSRSYSYSQWNPRCIHHHGVLTPRCIHHPGANLNWLTKKPAGAKYTKESRLPWHYYTGESSLPGLFVTRKFSCYPVLMLVPNTPRRWLHGVFTTGVSFWTQGSRFTDWCRLLQRLTDMLLMLNCLTQRILVDSPVYSSPGSQLRIRVTSWIFEKIQNRFWTCLLTWRSCLMKKTGDDKFRDTVPLISF
jgi:hypothetical protein